MTKHNDSFFARAYNPFQQALVLFAASVSIVLLSKVLHATGLLEVGERFPWMAAASFMLCFAVFNSLFSLTTENMNQYWSRSMISFAGLAVVNGFAAYLFSSLPIGEAGSYRWIYVVVTFGYLVFLSMMRFLRTIVEFAQREEWNQPRIRRKPGSRRR